MLRVVENILASILKKRQAMYVEFFVAEMKNKLHENFINSVAINVKLLILGLQ
jgi:hypothetical protein